MSTSARPDASELLAAYDAQLRDHVPDPLPKGASRRARRAAPALLRPLRSGKPRLHLLPRPRGTRRQRPRRVDRAAGARVHASAGSASSGSCTRTTGRRISRDRLREAGFVPEDEETVVIARVDEVASRPLLPDGVSLREVTDRTDLDRIAAFEQAAWEDEDEQGWIADMLEAERKADPNGISIVVAEADGAIVCAGWVRFVKRNGLRDALGRRHAAGLARTRDLPGHRRASGGRGRPARFSLPRGRCVQRQPPDPRAARVHRGDDDDAVRLVAATSS